MSDTPTPRTDAYESKLCAHNMSGFTLADDTRILERELAAANAALAEAKSHFDRISDQETEAMNAMARAEKAEAELATRTQTEAGLREQIGILWGALAEYAEEANWDDEITATEGGDEECKVYAPTKSLFYDNRDGWMRAKEAFKRARKAGAK